jgi:hypothetical protein
MSLPVQMLADRLQVVTCILMAHDLLAECLAYHSCFMSQSTLGLCPCSTGSALVHVRVHLGSALVQSLIGQVDTDDCGHAE